MIPVFKYLCGVCVGREEGEHNVYCTKFKPTKYTIKLK